MAGNRWTRAKIVALIRKLHAEGVDLSPTGIRKTHSALFSSARSRSHYGGWRAAIEAAGLDYSEIRRGEQVWSRERIIKMLLQAVTNGDDLLSAKFKDRNKRLYSAACARRHFGGWRKAIQAAGLNYDQLRNDHFWSPAKIIATIQDRARRAEPLNWSAIEKIQPSLYRAARRPENFGNWQAALRAAKVDLKTPRATQQWTRRRIIDEIRQLHRQGADLSQKAVMGTYGPLLAAAKSSRYFGTWREAVEAAGIDYDTVRKRRGRPSARTTAKGSRGRRPLSS